MHHFKSISFFIITIGVISILSSCGKKPQPKVVDENAIDENIKTFSCQADPTIQYTAFIPEHKTDVKLPAIIFFDPHCQGQLPVKNYAKLAYQYGYMLIGSLNLRNGLSPDQTQKTITTLLDEVISKYPVDSKQIYLSGFSGGAKVAMMYGLQLPQIAGVVACGGSINPQGFNRKGFCFTGIVGNKDFNYLDMMQTLSGFNQTKQPYSLIVFDGAHEWPPVDFFEGAFRNIETNVMKIGLKPKNKPWLKEVEQEVIEKSTILFANGQQLKSFELLNNAHGWFDGLIDDKNIKKKLDEIKNDPSFKKQLTRIQQMGQKEVELRSQFIQSIDKQDLTWWQTEVENIRQSILNKDELLSVTSQRLLNYLSMASYMLVNSDIQNQNTEGAFKKLQIYEMVDPENTDVYLMYARYYLLKGDKEKMVASVKKAIGKGFNKQRQYKEDPAWSLLFEQPELAEYLR